MTEAQVTAIIAAAAGVAGAVIGSANSLIRDIVTARSERRRERARLAVQLAIAEHEKRQQALESGLLPEGQRVLPLVLYVDYHSRFLEALEEGQMAPGTMRRLHEENRAVKEQLDQMPPYLVPEPRK